MSRKIVTAAQLDKYSHEQIIAAGHTDKRLFISSMIENDVISSLFKIEHSDGKIEFTPTLSEALKIYNS